MASTKNYFARQTPKDKKYGWNWGTLGEYNYPSLITKTIDGPKVASYLTKNDIYSYYPLAPKGFNEEIIEDGPISTADAQLALLASRDGRNWLAGVNPLPPVSPKTEIKKTLTAVSPKTVVKEDPTVTSSPNNRLGFASKNYKPMSPQLASAFTSPEWGGKIPSESEAKYENLLETAEPWETFSPRPPSTGVKQDDVFDSSRLFSRDIFNTRPGWFHALNDPSESMGTRIAAGAMPFATAATPFGGPLALLGGGLHAMGAYNPLNPQTTDSNIEYDPNRGKISYSTTSPGGYGLQYGDLSNMNTLANMAFDAKGNPTNAMVRIAGLPEGQNYAYAGELANYLQNQREFGPFDDYIQMPITDLAGAPTYQYETFADGVTNQEALSNYNATNAGPILNQAAELLGPDAGYNETRDLADSIAVSMQSQIDNQYGGSGFDIGGGITGGFGETYDPGEDFAAAYGDWL